jgi:Uma2 family endonuclease
VVASSIRLDYSFLDYVRFERDAHERHEFVQGLILAMAGGTLEHARRTAKVISLLDAQLRGKRCSVFDSNARVRVPSGNAYHPDATIVCGPLATDPEDPLSATNPTVVVEVLSPSTAVFDQNEKLEDYRAIPSLRHIVYVAGDDARVDVWTRAEDVWTMRSWRAGEEAALDAIGCVLDVSEIDRDPLS